MLEFVLQSVSLTIPILISGILLIVMIDRRYLRILDVSLDRGMQLGSAPIFGRNKTWRGVLVYLVVSIAVCVVLYAVADSRFVHPVFSRSPLYVGAAYGIAYITGELLNSFVKRRLGINSGSSRGSYFQKVIDHVDGMVAVSIVLYGVFAVAVMNIVCALLCGIVLHTLTDHVMKKRHLK